MTTFVDVLKAANKWQEISHMVCTDNHFDNFGDPKPDLKVCAREKAWREYCRIRDSFLNPVVTH